MQSEGLINHQIQVKVSNQGGKLTIYFPDGQEVVWPILGVEIPTGTSYLTLSLSQILPTKDELGKIILKEIFKLDE